MSNVYAAPVASLSTASEGEPTVMLELDTRIGRLRWMAYSLGMLFLCGLVVAVLQDAMGDTPSTKNVTDIVNGLLSLVALALVSRRRLRDVGMGIAFLFLAIIPVVNLYFLYLMLFKRGDPGSNKYGPAPSPNTRGVCVAAFILPSISLLGIVAAVAIPAYSSYQHAVQGHRPAVQSARP